MKVLLYIVDILYKMNLAQTTHIEKNIFLKPTHYTIPVSTFSILTCAFLHTCIIATIPTRMSLIIKSTNNKKQNIEQL